VLKNLLEKLVRHYHRGRSSRQEQGDQEQEAGAEKEIIGQLSFDSSIGYHRLHVGGVSIFTYNPDLTIPFGARSAPGINNDSAVG